MNFKLASRIVLILTFAAVSAGAADPLDKLPKKVRLQFLESLVIANGHPASARIGAVKKNLSRADWQSFKAMMGWSALNADHEGYCCSGAGECKKCIEHICDPGKCTGPCKSLAELLQAVPVRQRNDFLMGLRFKNGRATSLPLARVRSHLKPAAAAELEKMARQ
jgi:hypothetical protein